MKRETAAVVAWLESGFPRPARIEAEITAKCNLDCMFCWIQDPPPYRRENLHREMDTARWLDLVDETADLGAEIWRIGGGGEPMMRAETTVAVMLAIKRRSMIGHLTTNGTIFPDKDLQLVFESGWDVIEFSIDGPTPEVHDRLRGKSGAFAKTLAVLRKINQLKRRNGVSKPRVILSAVLVRDNLEWMPEMIRLAHHEGIEKVSINPMTVMVRDEYKKRIVWSMKVESSIAAIRDKVLQEAKEVADQLGIDTNVHHFIGNQLIEETNAMYRVLAGTAGDGVLRIPCYSPWYLASIRPHGTVGACCRFQDAGAESLHEKRFKDIWEGINLAALRSELSRDAIPPYCAGCSPNNIRFEWEIREELREYLADKANESHSR